ncbi:MAG TPA: PQQ-dependent sugar dehydrogenase [Gemmatimonadales bacterium]|nr:PQQ-dependent sugar dehydrogenase [Gemmatimonadales bacterium]
MIRLLPCLLLLLLGGCASWFDDDSTGPPPPPPPPPPPVVQLRAIGTYSQPTYVAAPPGDTARVLVTERTGRVWLLKSSVQQARPFLDLRGKIDSLDENGLYSLAFDPNYATNRKFYAFYTNLDGDIRIARYFVSATNPDTAEWAADTILAIPHPVAGFTLPFGNHHGGQLQFGPLDGKLYVSVGDGGCCGDPQLNGQRRKTLNGKLLRIDVSGGTGYTVPADNPYATDTSFAPEIWSWGFRNPWRFSFDRLTGDLYIGDVGQDAWEEVDATAGPNAGKGVNYGWSMYEGTHCYHAPCNSSGITMPVVEYAHAPACSVTGGYVYRGTRVTQLIGQYLYADLCTGFVGSFQLSGGVATHQTNWTSQLSPGGSIVSFGEDARGELYIVAYSGVVYRIVPVP